MKNKKSVWEEAWKWYFDWHKRHWKHLLAATVILLISTLILGFFVKDKDKIDMPAQSLNIVVSSCSNCPEENRCDLMNDGLYLCGQRGEPSAKEFYDKWLKCNETLDPYDCGTAERIILANLDSGDQVPIKMTRSCNVVRFNFVYLPFWYEVNKQIRSFFINKCGDAK